VNEVTDTSLGRIGVSVNGAQILNGYEQLSRAEVQHDCQLWNSDWLIDTAPLQVTLSSALIIDQVFQSGSSNLREQSR
jgi:hypothetical protein